MKSVSLALNPVVFRELEKLAFSQSITLSELYLAAINKYLNECSIGRHKVLAAPEAGKRVRINLEIDTYDVLVIKIGTSGYGVKDIVYTALEYTLNKEISVFAA